MKSTTKTDFYCNQKFWWLTVDLGKFATSNCCAASPHKVDIDWIKNNPGRIFNSRLLQEERRLMLQNQPVESCEAACWRPEAQNLLSRRLVKKGYVRSHEDINAIPEVVNIVVGQDCNMTCVYCCKYFSTAWARDVAKSSYVVVTKDDRFVRNNKDRVLEMLSQKDLTKSQFRAVLVEELDMLYQQPQIKEVQISGGEPFLYLDLSRLISTIPSHIEIKIFSGLGVEEKRFAREIDKIPNHVTLMISAENIGQAYEFVRYGNTWQRFCNNMKTLQTAGINYKFASTLSNITLPGIPCFLDYAKDAVTIFSLCSDPDFLAINVLDDQTKLLVMQNDRYPAFVKNLLDVPASETQVQDFRVYIKDFAARRSLDFSFFPKSLTDWIGP